MSARKYTADQNFPDYLPERSKSLVAKHLTKEMYARLYEKKTSNGVTIDKCIQPSIDSKCDTGLCAGDPECYEVFKELFDKVIDDKHGGFGPNEKHPPPELSPDKLTGGVLDEKYVKSCRIRTGRSLKGFCLPPSICRAERREVEKILVEALGGLTGDLAGKYYPLKGMTPEEEKQLIADHFLFQKPKADLLIDSGSVHDWPDARGIWHNNGKTFLVWINEEDHSRIISMQKGGDIKAVFERFCRGLEQINQLMKKNNKEFARNERLGFICMCPTNIGTGLRASVHMQMHKLCKHPQFKEIVEELQLQKRGTSGEDTDSVDDVFDISNSARLKKTERQFVQLLIDGVNKLIEMEKRLEQGKDITDLLPPNCAKAAANKAAAKEP